jgi:hypothetical protein
MGFLDWLLGRRNSRQPEPRHSYERSNLEPGQLTDEQAIERYRYMLRTAPPETVEQAHAEAFAQLTPAQRAQVLQGLSAEISPQERASLRPDQDDPQTLARLATRAEMRRPGTLERTFGGMGGGMMGGGMMGMGMGGTFLSAMAGSLVGTMIAQQFFDGFDTTQGSGGEETGGYEQEVGADQGYEDSGLDAGGDVGEDFGGDFGSEF